MAGARDCAASFDLVGPGSPGARPSHNLAHYAGSVGLLGVVLVVLSVGTVAHFNSQHRWSFAIAIAVLFIARGVHLGRPVTAAHVAATAATILVALLIEFAGYVGVSLVLFAVSGLVLMWPTASRPQPECLPTVYALVDRTPKDPLAPFAMHSLKSYFFSEKQAAVIGYHTRLGVAVVSGDPIGDPAYFPVLVTQFRHFCQERGWRIVVLAAGESCLGLWCGGRGMASVACSTDRSRRGDRGRDIRHGRQAIPEPAPSCQPH